MRYSLSPTLRAKQSATPTNFHAPFSMREHNERVFTGEYELPLDGSFAILDIGANCGAYSVWAARRWPGSEIFAYEPVPLNYEYLKVNAERVSESRIELANCAISAAERKSLYLGKNNCGEASFFPGDEQLPDTVPVSTLYPSELPFCHILKCDTEGCETEIILNYLTYGRKPLAICFEYHSETDRRLLDHMLRDYSIVRGSAMRYGRGTICYLRNEYAEQLTQIRTTE